MMAEKAGLSTSDRAAACAMTSAAERFTPAHWTRKLLQPQILLAIVIAATLLGLAALEPRVISTENLRNILTQASFLALFASAQAVVILTRGFDLSLGTTVSVVSVSAALALTHLPPSTAVLLGISAGLGIGLCIGTANGALVAWCGINPFVATLGTASVLSSIVSTISGGFPVTGLPAAFSWFATGAIAGLPLPVVIAALVLLGLHGLVSRGRMGRSFALVGSNPQAAHVAGINVKFTRLTAYALCSLLAGLGALMLTARTGSGEPNLGASLTLETIAAAVLGGMRLRGGEGSMAAPVLGALFITVLSNGMALVQVDGYLQQVLLGLVILVSLAFDGARGTH